jgi:hypothetical protein
LALAYAKRGKLEEAFKVVGDDGLADFIKTNMHPIDLAAAGVSLVNFRKKDCFQKIVKNIGLEPCPETVEKPPYSSYAPKGAEVSDPPLRVGPEP